MSSPIDYKDFSSKSNLLSIPKFRPPYPSSKIYFKWCKGFKCLTYWFCGNSGTSRRFAGIAGGIPFVGKETPRRDLACLFNVSRSMLVSNVFRISVVLCLEYVFCGRWIIWSGSVGFCLNILVGVTDSIQFVVDDKKEIEQNM